MDFNKLITPIQEGEEYTVVELRVEDLVIEDVVMDWIGLGIDPTEGDPFWQFEEILGKSGLDYGDTLVLSNFDGKNTIEYENEDGSRKGTLTLIEGEQQLLEVKEKNFSAVFKCIFKKHNSNIELQSYVVTNPNSLAQYKRNLFNNSYQAELKIGERIIKIYISNPTNDANDRFLIFNEIAFQEYLLTLTNPVELLKLLRELIVIGDYNLKNIDKIEIINAKASSPKEFEEQIFVNRESLFVITAGEVPSVTRLSLLEDNVASYDNGIQTIVVKGPNTLAHVPACEDAEERLDMLEETDAVVITANAEISRVRSILTHLK